MSKPVIPPDAVHPWNDPEWRARAQELSRRLGIPEDQQELVVRALTHRSLAEVATHGDNERLEFLGDSVLSLVVAEHLFRTHPKDAEGQLTKLKIRYVSEPSLAAAAAALGIGECLAIAPGDEVGGGRARPSTLSDTFEAVLAAIYLASGLEAAREFVLRELIGRTDPGELWDHKSRLQELYQEKHKVTPVYTTDVESGPAHDRVFSSNVVVDGQVIGSGTGKSKKLAEQAAAADALARIEQKKPRARKKKPAQVKPGTAPPPAES